MSLEHCAEIVEAADPDRFKVTALASDKVQEILWPLYAFNVEVTRAPWVTQEPMIAEIRLQWWRDALEEIREGRPVRAHGVTVPLAQILDPEAAMSLDQLVSARKWDIYADPFDTEDAFDRYIDATYGNLMWTAARLVAPDVAEQQIRKFAYGCGVAAMFRATPELVARGRSPLPSLEKGDVYSIAKNAYSALQEVRQAHRFVPDTLAPVMLSGWTAAPILKAALEAPEVVPLGTFTQSEFARRARLLKLSMFGWWR